MTKEKWEKMRNNPDLEHVSMEVWWEFYKEKGGMLDDIKKFIPIMNKIIGESVLINGKITNLQTALSRLKEHYDNKFGIARVVDDNESER